MAGKPKLTEEQRIINRKAQIKAWRDKNPYYDQKYYEENKDATKIKLQENYRKIKEKQPWVLMLRNVRNRAKQKNLEFNLDSDYLKSIWTDTCPIFKVKLYPAVFESGQSRNHKSKAHDYSPSLDRIDSSKGYVKGNVMIMSYRANVIKNSGTALEHRQIAEFLENLIGKSVLG